MSDVGGELRDAERRDRRRVAERLVVVVGELGQQLDRVEADDLLGVVGPEVARPRRVRSAARRTPAPRSRSRTSGPARPTARPSAPTTTLESMPPLRKTPDRDVAPEPQPDRFAEQLDRPSHESSSSAGDLRLVVGRPVPARCAARHRPTSGRWPAAACGRPRGSSMRRGMYWCWRNRSSASRSTSARASGSLRIAFSSDP